MVCETRLRGSQTLSERKADVRRAVNGLNSLVGMGRVRVKVGPQGAIAFEGWGEAERDGVSDACAYRLLMSTASSLTKMKIQAAEMAAGRTVNRQVIGQGVHSHDGGKSWHDGH
jgi:hypothetical protein